MTKKRQLGSCVTFFPQPTTLVATVDGEGKADLMTASWAGIVSKTPPTMAVSLHHNRLTYANICATKSFSVNLVPAHLAVQADYCGITSGRSADKVATSGLTLTPATLIEAPLVEESPLNVECRFVREVELGEYRLVMGEIVEIHALEEAFAKYPQGDARVFDPLVYLGGIREYWGLGEKSADAYRDGKRLLENEAD